jgi:hypothetical protein
MCKSIKKMLTALLASSFISFVPLVTSTKADGSKEHMREVASSIVERLPLNKKIVLKALPPEQSGLPEEFLKRLLNDLEAELLNATDFKVKLANRFTTEELWSEAVEFGDANFDELYKATQSDLMLLMDARASGSGIEVSISIYNLLGENAGQVVASSGVKYLDIDTEKALGVNLMTVEENIDLIKSQVAELQKSGGIVKNPNAFAEFVHNAISYRNTGALQLAQNNYESAIFLEPMFFDVLDAYLNIIVARFGRKGAIKYYEEKLRSGFNKDQNDFSQLFLYGYTDGIVPDLNKSPLYSSIIPPLLVAWMPTVMTTSADVFITPSEDREKLYGNGTQSAWYFSGYQLKNSLLDGEFFRFFLNSEKFLIRAEDIVWNWELTLRNSEFVCGNPIGACQNMRDLKVIKDQIFAD